MVTRCLLAGLLVLTLVMWTGCGQTPEAGSETAHQEPDAHAHGETGPHDGHLIEVGSYHVELAPDHDTHRVTFYLLDGELKPVTEGAASAASVSVFQDGDFVDYAFQPAETPGQFILDDDKLCHALDHDEVIKARVRITVDGEEVIGKYEHEPHGDEDPHDH